MEERAGCPREWVPPDLENRSRVQQKARAQPGCGCHDFQIWIYQSSGKCYTLPRALAFVAWRRRRSVSGLVGMRKGWGEEHSP